MYAPTSYIKNWIFPTALKKNIGEKCPEFGPFTLSDPKLYRVKYPTIDTKIDPPPYKNFFLTRFFINYRSHSFIISIDSCAIRCPYIEWPPIINKGAIAPERGKCRTLGHVLFSTPPVSILRQVQAQVQKIVISQQSV